MNTRILYKAALAPALLLALSACDNIDEDQRLVPIEIQHSEKVVLIEEFTGARCVNCPGGAEKVHAIMESEAFAGKVVAVSMYPEQMAQLTDPITTDLRTPEASAYFSAFDGPSKGLPAAAFDRTSFDGSVLQLKVETWNTFVSNCLTASVTVPVNIELTADYDAASGSLQAGYDVMFAEPVLEDVSFQLWLTEDGILSRQASLTGLIRDYENNHVLRAALNGTWGESLGAGHSAATAKSGKAKIALKQDWVPENMHLVGFLYRTADRRVIQACEIPIIKVQTEE